MITVTYPGGLAFGVCSALRWALQDILLPSTSVEESSSYLFGFSRGISVLVPTN